MPNFSRVDVPVYHVIECKCYICSEKYSRNLFHILRDEALEHEQVLYYLLYHCGLFYFMEFGSKPAKCISLVEGFKPNSKTMCL